MTTIVHCSKGVHFTAEYVFFFCVRPPPFKHPVWLWLFPKGYKNMRKAYFPALATSPSQSFSHVHSPMPGGFLLMEKWGKSPTQQITLKWRHFPLPHSPLGTRVRIPPSLGLIVEWSPHVFKSIPWGPVRWFYLQRKVPFSYVFTQQALVTVTTCLPVKLVISINLAIMSK